MMINAHLAWYVNGIAQSLVEVGNFLPGDYLGRFWLVNTGTRPLTSLRISETRGRALFSSTYSGSRSYDLTVGTINPGGRGICHAWVNPVAMTGPLHIVADERVK